MRTGTAGRYWSSNPENGSVTPMFLRRLTSTTTAIKVYYERGTTGVAHKER